MASRASCPTLTALQFEMNHAGKGSGMAMT
jgi:hypothetical protein